MQKIVAIGDCNTLGVGPLERCSYPEVLEQRLGVEVVNCGYTMATSREGIHLLRDNIDDADCVTIQFGLVDSYTSFRYSPYVLYYPERLWRKPMRHIIKKYRKICRKKGLLQRFGEKNIVGPVEYEKNVRLMIALAQQRRVILLETIPHHEQQRNDGIVYYNTILERISRDYSNCSKVNVYEVFSNNLHHYYLDQTHSNRLGYECIAERILDTLNSYERILRE